MHTSQAQDTHTRRLATFTLLFSLVCGCETAIPEKPLDVPQAVNELESLHNSIRDFCNGDKSIGGHESLHRVHTMLTALAELSPNDSIDESSRREIVDAASQMIDEYSQMDKQVHEGKEIEYEPFQEPLESLLDQIKAAAGV